MGITENEMMQGQLNPVAFGGAYTEKGKYKDTCKHKQPKSRSFS